MTQDLGAPTNFNPWDLFDRFTVHEAAMLWLNRDPNSADGDMLDSQYGQMKEALIRAFQTGQLTGMRAYATLEDLAADESPVLWNDTKIDRDSLVQWAHQKGVRPEFLERDLSALDSVDVASYGQSPASLPPHIDPWIALLLKGFERYWANYDSNDPDRKSPSNDDVINWFKGKVIRKNSLTGEVEKVTNDVARVFARLIRPDDAPTGRRKDTLKERREKDGYELHEIE